MQRGNRVSTDAYDHTSQSPLAFTNFGEGSHVIVTGGQGFVGSHTVLRMLEEGFLVTVLDNGSNSHSEAMVRVKGLVSPMQAGNLFMHEVDLCDMTSLKATMMAVSQTKKIDACVHLAGLKGIGESARMPLKYHQNNLTATLNLLEMLEKHGCRQLVFSSSAAVYGSEAACPVTEEALLGENIPTPYGRSKFFIERVLEDLYASQHGKEWGIVILRYFNPVGAHPSGRLGEDPNGPPNNLVPYVAQVAMGRREHLTVLGDDHETADGTTVRDYVHVMDVAEGHLAGLSKLMSVGRGYLHYNLGAGKGTSVLELVHAMETASGLKVLVKVGKRRPGDPPSVYCDVQKASRELGWEPYRDAAQICKDTWRWFNANPNGYIKPDKEFGAFKQASFQKSSMPKLSSSSRESSRKPPPAPSAQHSDRVSRNSSNEMDQAIRGRGTSMDDVIEGTEEDDVDGHTAGDSSGPVDDGGAIDL